jgi:hypothetical protein
LPARCPSEALELLDALFNALEQFREARLLIKPHPYDLVDLYQRRIDERGMGSRVHLVHDSIEALISRASIVFSEDSTAGMDGMFAAKPLIHLHFAPVSPAMPFVEYAAALPGFNSEELLCSIEATLSANRGAAAHMLDGQIAFLRDFAGPCDGHAGARLAESLKRLLAE